jgi:hypothetical protein
VHAQIFVGPTFFSEEADAFVNKAVGVVAMLLSVIFCTLQSIKALEEFPLLLFSNSLLREESACCLGQHYH